MKIIKNGIVFSNDVKTILDGRNAFDYSYGVNISNDVINSIREDFKRDVCKIFNGDVTIISEDEMSNVNNFIGGGYPHCQFR